MGFNKQTSPRTTVVTETELLQKEAENKDAAKKCPKHVWAWHPRLGILNFPTLGTPIS